MRRDSDLIRAILIALESDDHCEVLRLPRFAGYTAEAIHFHVLLLVEKGYVETAAPAQPLPRSWFCLRLTWEGYDLLDHVRDPVVWRATKVAAGKVGSWSLETLAAIAKSMIIAKLETLGLAS